MKPIVIVSLVLFSINPIIVKSQDALNHLYIIIPKINEKGSKISFMEHKKGISIGAYITFDKPNFSVRISHMPSWVDYPLEGNRDEIEVTYSDLLQANLLFADKLSFDEWDQIELSNKHRKIYMVFHEDFMSKNRFILNHKFKAFEVNVTADGPI